MISMRLLLLGFVLCLIGCRVGAVDTLPDLEQVLVITVDVIDYEQDDGQNGSTFSLKSRIETVVASQTEDPATLNRTNTIIHLPEQFLHIGEESEFLAYAPSSYDSELELVQLLDGGLALGKRISTGMKFLARIEDYDVESRSGIVSATCIKQCEGLITFYSSFTDVEFTVGSPVILDESDLPEGKRCKTESSLWHPK